ncbi:MAG TPA: hypothetical protein VHN19_03155 [Burkholderiales bacterium]|jgi:hypothetical protein|nr:hypothetical protein [Burkholderiales bacterium]
MTDVRAGGGAALLGLVAILALAIAALFIARIERGHSSAAERRHNGEVLRYAREALLGHVTLQAALASEANPGRLPCPEAAGFFGTASEGVAAASCRLPAIGRLPWRTLGLEKLRDAAGEALWYAVSPGWALPNTTSSLKLNSNSTGQLAVDGSAGAAVAIIFAPGRPLQVAASPGCPARDQGRRVKDIAGNAVTPDVRDYLECENAAVPSTGSFATRGASGRAFNDQAIVVTAAEILPLLEAAVAIRTEREIAPALRAYAGSEWGLESGSPLYPYAARFAAASFNPDNHRGQAGELQGLLPLTRAQGCNPASDPRCDAAFVAWLAAPAPAFAALPGSSMQIYTDHVPMSQCVAGAAEVQCTLYTSPNGALNLAVSATASNVAMALRRLDKAVAAQGFAPDGPASPRAAAGSFNTDGSARITFSGLVDAAGTPATCTRASPPAAVPCQRRVVSLPIEVLADHALLDPQAPATGWFVRNDWHQLAYYAVSPGHAASSSAPRTCGLAPADCLSVAGGKRARALLVLPGRSLSGKSRPSADLADYLDSDENRNGDAVFEQRRVNRSFNDRVLLVEAAP